jgi:hypothetical protein
LAVEAVAVGLAQHLSAQTAAAAVAREESPDRLPEQERSDRAATAAHPVPRQFRSVAAAAVVTEAQESSETPVPVRAVLHISMLEIAQIMQAAAAAAQRLA